MSLDFTIQCLILTSPTLVIVHEPDTKKWLLVPSLLNKVHVDFWEGMHLSSWKMYDSIDHFVACGFYGMYFTKSK